MGITKEQTESAQKRQFDAAHDTSAQVRLIAGPGSGKSYSIQERVKWLLGRNVNPDTVFVVSFTRASTLDLRNRIIRYCQDANYDNVNQISVSTLHSLALRTLRSAGKLNYPVDPVVLSKWEQEKIFDNEFSKTSGYSSKNPGVGYSPGRCKEIRTNYEALCGTGQINPPNYIPPNVPISEEERLDYDKFRNPRTQIYSCVLPGEIVLKCVESIRAGNLNPADLLNIQYLIVDEYQDLNPIDLEFVDYIINSGVKTFVAGDDDQSIYSFRYASPQGIQSFVDRFPQVGDHELKECFRCASEVLFAAQDLMDHFSEPKRIKKNLKSLYLESYPPVPGAVYRWKYKSYQSEAKYIAESCDALIKKGVPANEIMILISNKRALLPKLVEELEKVDVDFETPILESFFESEPGRFVFAMIRIICNSDDYMAHRLILGLRPGVGLITCNKITESVIANNLNYHDVFYRPLIPGVFTKRESSALDYARNICGQISAWSPEDTLEDHFSDISDYVEYIFGEQESLQWQASLEFLPKEITFEELRDYLQAKNDEQQESLLKLIYERLCLPIPDEGLLPPKVRIMTMHNAKGLSAQVVFIPGLMEDILPGNMKKPFAGLVFEAARMLYVSITRARAACILSYSTSRVVFGEFASQSPSRFADHLKGKFLERETGLLKSEVEMIYQSTKDL